MACKWMEDKKNSRCLCRGRTDHIPLSKAIAGITGMQAGSFGTRSIDSAFICTPSVCCVNGPHNVSLHVGIRCVDGVRAHIWCALSAHGISLVEACRELWSAESGALWYSLDTHSGPGSAQAEPAPRKPEPYMSRAPEFKGRYMFNQ